MIQKIKIGEEKKTSRQKEKKDERDPLAGRPPPVFYYFCPSFIDIWPTIKLSLSLSLSLQAISDKQTNIPRHMSDWGAGIDFKHPKRD